MAARKKPKAKSGNIIEIQVDDDNFCYALALEEPLHAFFDYRSHEKLDAVGAAERPVLFRVWVMRHGVTSGRWNVIGRIDLPDRSPLENIVFSKRDMISGQLTGYSKGVEVPITAEEAKHLEPAAVWEPTHIEDRLRDHFAGRSNIWLESLRRSRV